MSALRIGQGFDVHAFGTRANGPSSNKIVLGGVVIPYVRGLVAHSDGDVLLHALCDALLGALALGDIGQHFPDTDPQYLNVNSRDLLTLVNAKLQSEGWCTANADMTIMAQEPKMAPHIHAMRENIAADLKTDLKNVSIKATTTEALGFVGRKEGIAASACVLLQPI